MSLKRCRALVLQCDRVERRCRFVCKFDGFCLRHATSSGRRGVVEL